MSRRKTDPAKWLSQVEQAQLRRLVYRAFAVRGQATGLRDAVQAIEDWQWQTCPERHARRVT